MNRRQLLKTLGITAAAPTLLFTEEQQSQRRNRWDFLFSPIKTIPATFAPDPSTWSNDTITAAWIGHATVLVNFYGTWIITDPVFSNKVGVSMLGMGVVGPKRLVDPALTYDKLPKIDLVLISHGHMDHCDLPSLELFPRNTPFVMAANTTDIIDGIGKPRASVVELDWGQSANLLELRVEAVRVKHFGWRFPWEQDRSRGNWEGRSFNSYLVSKGEKAFLFGGDMAYHEFFKPLATRGLDIELAIMPIGAYDPWVMSHCNPEEAVKMADHMGAKAILPIHFETFIMSEEPLDQPASRFKNALATQPDRIALSQIGETWSNGKSFARPATPLRHKFLNFA